MAFRPFLNTRKPYSDLSVGNEPGLDGSAPSATPINVNGAAHSHAEDPFAAHRTEDDNPFAERSDSVPGLGSSPTQSGFSPKRDRRESKEWGALILSSLIVVAHTHTLQADAFFLSHKNNRRIQSAPIEISEARGQYLCHAIVARRTSGQEQ